MSTSNLDPRIYLSTKILDLDLPARIENLVLGLGARTVGDLLAHRASELAKRPGWGKKTLQYLDMLFRQEGLRFAPAPALAIGDIHNRRILAQNLEIFLLHHALGKSYAEIGRSLGVSGNRVRQRAISVGFNMYFYSKDEEMRNFWLHGRKAKKDV